MILEDEAMLKAPVTAVTVTVGDVTAGVAVVGRCRARNMCSKVLTRTSHRTGLWRLREQQQASES